MKIQKFEVYIKEQKLIEKINMITENNITENVKLSKDEVTYLWSKIETLKKKKAIETENDLFKLLNGSKTSFNDEEFHKILNALEYNFKKKLKDDTMNTDNAHSIHKKLPEDWVGVKYTKLDTKKKRDEKEKEDKKVDKKKK